MPFRMLGYTARTLESIYNDVNFFSTKQQRIMVPEFYVLYNGVTRLPDESVLRLSDSYVENPPENSAEIVVKVIDVGYNEDKEVLKKSRTLYEYSRFIQIVRETLAGRSDKDAAIREAIQQAIREGILADFLKQNGAEVADMAFRQFNYDEYIEQLKKDYYEDGKEVGEKRGEARGIKLGERRGEARGIKLGERRGEARGLKQGEACFAILVNRLLDDARTDDLQKAAEDSAYRQKLYEEYGIELPQ